MGGSSMSRAPSNIVLEAFLEKPDLYLTQAEIRALVVEVLKSRYVLERQYRTLEALLEDRDGFRQLRQLVGERI
tara:strand:+ start:641 stop:862 length:222 start_codon:yes stop_codon:yes gene_type:complete